MTRKMSDCRKFPSDTGCTLVIVGTESELMHAAIEHAVSVHGHTMGPELGEELRKTFVDAPAGM